MSERILVIKLGALGDFVQAFAPFAAIRAHHPQASITLLTTSPFVALASTSPWFDAVWVDARPKFWQLTKVRELRHRLREGDFARVYDLQTSDRSSWYFRLMPRGTEWSGIAKGCSHPHTDPHRDRIHTVERQAGQLAEAGIPRVPPPDLSWAEGDIGKFELAAGEDFALLCPGGAPHRPAKRWPAPAFAATAARLPEQGIRPVVLGTQSEKAESETICTLCPTALDLTTRTNFLDILALGRRAKLALGNDTGPMHLLAASGCPSAVLFSHASDPALCAPRGRVEIVRAPSLVELETAQVWEILRGLASLPALDRAP